jgi:hypothetical protein
MRPAEHIARWRKQPIQFVRENFRAEPDAWQADVLWAFVDPKIPRIAMQACVGPGKSTVMAWCGWLFLSCYGDANDHPKGFCTSITGDNLAANLWPEYRKWQRQSLWLSETFTWASERIYANDHKETWFLEARTWPRSSSADEQGKTLSGLHGGYVLVQADESGAIPPAVGRAGEQALAGHVKFGKLMQAGNPLSTGGMLYEATDGKRWHVIRITGDPDDSKRSPRIPIEWARDQIARYGRDNPWVMAHVLGRFPPSAINALLTPDQVRDAMARRLSEPDYWHMAKVLGVDVAREGDDRSCFIRRQGRRAWKPNILRNVDSLQGAGAVSMEWNDWAADACFVDNTGGWGAGWVDQLRALGRNPIPIAFSGAATQPGRYLNKRTEMWFEMAEWVKEGGALPDDVPEFVPELTSPLYWFKGDVLQLEPKELIKARLGYSPDIGDALALTFAMPVVPADPMGPTFREENARQAWDPLGRERHRNRDRDRGDRHPRWG